MGDRERRVPDDRRDRRAPVRRHRFRPRERARGARRSRARGVRAVRRPLERGRSAAGGDPAIDLGQVQVLAARQADDQHEQVLESHRREVTVVFCDLRGFTAFSETTEPEEVMGVLREFHAAMGELIYRYEGTLERFTGDGMMIFFNDPVTVPNPAERALRMTVEMRDRAEELAARWRQRGYELHVGIGIAQGYATIGAIGFEGRLDYGAIGTVTNIAARLCGEAQGGQILISQRVHAAVSELVETEPLGELNLRGLLRPVTAFKVTRLKSAQA